MSKTHFVLYRNNWRRVGHAYYRLPGEVRVATYDSFEEAEGERVRLEVHARSMVNPFAGEKTLIDVTSLPMPVFHDWLLDAGIEPSNNSNYPRQWADWWRNNHYQWTIEQDALIWEGLGLVRFYFIREETISDALYVVMSMQWNTGYRANWVHIGGILHSVHATRVGADIMVRALNRTAQTRLNNNMPFDLRERLETYRDPFGPKVPDDAFQISGSQFSFHYIVQIERPDDMRRRIHIVLQNCWRCRWPGTFDWDDLGNGQTGIPIHGFVRHIYARRCLEQLELEACKQLNPVRFAARQSIDQPNQFIRELRGTGIPAEYLDTEGRYTLVSNIKHYWNHQDSTDNQRALFWEAAHVNFYNLITTTIQE